MKQYQTGDDVRFTFNFDRQDVATDPTAITFKLKSPSGTVTSYTYAGSDVIRVTTGRYYFETNFSEVGVWAWRLEATGEAAGAEQGKFVVQPALA